MKLYKLKSNPNTIVSRDGEFHHVQWSNSMFSGTDTRWMMAKWNPKNVIPLTKKEAKEVNERISKFNSTFRQ